MRPVTLEVEGFGPYRDPTKVDFDGVDVFALAGPTGSGKSTVVDAICFALYGSVPRYDDRRLVAPAISQGMPEALVRLVFTVDGVEHTAVRLVKRTKTGATTKEARLERGGEVLAGNEKELTDAVEQLLGLSYEHFTTCVVLPQGDFARFLHDKPERRQELLVRLLDLGVYGQMARLAHARSRDDAARAVALTERLEALAGATSAARQDAHDRVARLERLLGELEARLPEIAAWADEASAARVEAAALAAESEELAALTVPDGLADAAASLAAAVAAEAAADRAAVAAAAAVDHADAQRRALGDASALDRLRHDHGERAAQLVLVDKGEAAQRAAQAGHGEALAHRHDAAAALAAAEAQLDARQAEHAAHALRAHLAVGQPCPVCEQLVAAAPTAAAPSDLRAAEDDRQRRAELAAAAERTLAAAAAELERINGRLETERRKLAELDARLEGAPGAAEVEAKARAIVDADGALTAARDAEREAVLAHRAAADDVRRWRALDEEARRGLVAAHAMLAGRGAPALEGADVAADWEVLVAWAQGEAVARADRARTRHADADAVERRREEALAELRATGEEAGIVVGSGLDLREAAVVAHTNAGRDLEQLRRDEEEAAQRREELAVVEHRRDVAAALHGHLGARGFERWLLDDLLANLVTGATETLLELSGGQYSIVADDRSFAVVDHRDADQVRSARSLSGGETFLASLALALALADQLALLSGRGAARLESMFLDEGFGTLDPDTLDTVASAIDELGSRGRMVGLISHIPALAERAPVRYLVSKTGNAAAIVREG